MAKWKKSPQTLIDLFYTTLENFNQVQMRKMFGYPCCFINGNMFTGLHEENWVLRLPEPDRLELQALGALPFEPMGRKMREYLRLPQSIQSDPTLLASWLQRSFSYASSLPPK